MIKNIKTQVLINMLDIRMNRCLLDMERAMKKDGKLMVDTHNSYYILWGGGHFSFDAFDTMKELKAKLQKQEEIEITEDTFSLPELVQLLKACDPSEVRSYLVDCLIARLKPSK